MSNAYSAITLHRNPWHCQDRSASGRLESAMHRKFSVALRESDTKKAA